MIRAACLGVFAAAAYGCARLQTIVQPAPPPELEAGIRSLREGKGDTAQSAFDRAMSASRGDPVVAQAVLRACAESGRRDLVDRYVAQTFTFAGRSDKRLQAALHTVASGALEAVGDRESAISHAEQAYALAPDSWEVMNALGFEYAVAGIKLDRAIDLTTRAVQAARDANVAPADLGVSAVDSLGWAYYKSGRFEDALRTLLMASDMSPSSGDVCYHLAETYHALGKDDEARRVSQHGINLPFQTPGIKQEMETLNRLLAVRGTGPVTATE